MNFQFDVAAIIALLALIFSILATAISTLRESHTRFVDNFNKLYQRTFSLRAQLNSIVQADCEEDFYYEIDRIWHCEELRDMILDYLTEMENFFFLVVGHWRVKRSFEKLMSLALYQRLSVLYGFILRWRRESENQKLFLNYEKY